MAFFIFPQTPSLRLTHAPIPYREVPRWIENGKARIQQSPGRLTLGYVTLVADILVGKADRSSLTTQRLEAPVKTRPWQLSPTVGLTEDSPAARGMENNGAFFESSHSHQTAPQPNPEFVPSCSNSKI